MRRNRAYDLATGDVVWETTLTMNPIPSPYSATGWCSS